ncbi:MAG: hypothetical protein OER88_06570 [Planctomycetota bacterium]|nr:hypothetical protein [Planctomycetota bacterium]
MTTQRTWVLVGFVLLLGLAVADGAEAVEFTGRVLDATGKPVAGIKVGTYWIAKDGRWVTHRGVRTDEQGNFTLKEYLSSRARSLMALDAKQEHGAVTTLDAKAVEKPLLLRLQPTTLVRAAFENTGLGYEIEKTHVSFTARPAMIAVATHMGAPSLSLRLPPGDYGLRIGGVDCKRMSKRITLTKDMRTVDLGATDLEPTIIAQHYGKEPPAWTVSDARGMDAKATLADYKGKWVLLEFWGYW